MMALKEITEGLPHEVSNQLMSNERVYYFTYIVSEGGCGSSGEKDKYWLALTETRVMYKTKFTDNSRNSKKKVIERDGDLPFSKISFIEVSEGLSVDSLFELRISSSGGTIIIPIPTKAKGNEIRRIYSELSRES
ncbi:MAG: PH domain-containing protein [Flavobacteriaceae bacterium]